MAGRPRHDGTPTAAPNKRKLTDMFVSARKPQARDELIWDLKQPGLALSNRTTGRKAYKVIYSFHGRPRWFHIGDVRKIGLADARRLAAKMLLEVIEGKDPATERKAERANGTFADVAKQYVDLHAKRHNKSWLQAERLVTRHLLPRWGKLKIDAVTRADVRAAMLRIEAPIVANQVLASASAIFTWAIGQEMISINPCVGVDRNPVSSRERVLSDAEIRQLWPRLDPTLKLILLTGQRPGEVIALQREHVVDGWWQMPGEPVGNWPGTKNGRAHRVWLSEPAQALLDVPRGKRASILMRELVAELGLPRATPHDLRRSCLTTITRLKFGRDAMDRVANHRKGGVTDTYDRYGYADEDKAIMIAVGRHILEIVNGQGRSNVVKLR